MPILSPDHSLELELIEKRNRSSQPEDVHFEAIERLLPDELTLKLELLEKAICRKARGLLNQVSESPSWINFREFVEAMERELAKEITRLALDHYLYKIGKLLEFRVFFEAEEVACAYYEKVVVRHPEFLCELLKTCFKCIQEQRLAKETIEWVFKNRIQQILVPMTKITILELDESIDYHLNQSNIYYQLKIIIWGLSWLTTSECAWLTDEVLEQMLVDVYQPLLKKAKSYPEYHLHVNRFGLNANFEWHCRCSEHWYSPHLIKKLEKQLLFRNHLETSRYALRQLNKVVDFSDTTVDILIASYIRSGELNQVLRLIRNKMIPALKDSDASKRRQACWILNVSLASNSEHIFYLLHKIRAQLEELLADPCPAVRKEARLIWLKVALVPSNEPELARMLPQIVAKILAQEDYATLIKDEPDLLLLEGIGCSAKTIEFNFSHWLLLPIFQQRVNMDRLPVQFYENLLAFYPEGVETDRVVQLLRRSSEQIGTRYESLLWTDNTIKAAFDVTTLTASLRLYLERPDLPTECYCWLKFRYIRVRPPVYPKLKYYPRWVASATIKLFELLAEALTISARRIDVQFVQDMILLACAVMDRDIMRHPFYGNVSHHIESAKMLELLAIRAHQQGLQDELTGRVLREMLAAMDQANERHSSWAVSIQTMTVINFVKHDDRSNRYKSVQAILEQLNFDFEPQGIHNKRIILMLISKYIEHFNRDLDRLKELVPMAISLCDRLISAYKLREDQEYCIGSEDCLPTCIELAFPTSFDSVTEAGDYQCEFVLFQHSLDRIGDSHMQSIVDSLDESQQSSLHYYRNATKFVETKKSRHAEVKFQCLGHHRLLENSCESDRCPLLASRKFVRRKAEKSTHIWPEPPLPGRKRLRSSSAFKGRLSHEDMADT